MGPPTKEIRIVFAPPPPPPPPPPSMNIHNIWNTYYVKTRLWRWPENYRNINKEKKIENRKKRGAKGRTKSEREKKKEKATKERNKGRK